MTRHRLLALDLALGGTGLAFADGIRIITERVAPPSNLKGYARHWHVAERLLTTIAEVDPDIVLVEGYALHGKGALSLVRSAELGGIVRSALERRRIPVAEVPPTSLKRWATGKGNASKDQMTAAAIELDADAGVSGDEADAYLLLLMGEHVYNGAATHTRWLDAIAALDWPNRKEPRS